MTDHDNENENQPTRRAAIHWGLWTILGIMAASAAWPVYELVTRRGKKKKLAFYRAAALDELPEVGMKKAELNLRGGERPDTRVFIMRDASGALTVFSATCTHLSCLINYNRLKDEFVCPCHGGVFDKDGNVVSGPPPRPLERLPVKVEGGDVMVGFYV
ncbi:MAG: Rieske (2Fe-2S) protein [Nitrospirae bacterium]|nr:Rieske (2Fe-2S) protein [Nitrospirota bacterium]